MRSLCQSFVICLLKHILEDIFSIQVSLGIPQLINVIGGISEFNIYFACFGPSRPAVLVVESLCIFAQANIEVRDARMGDERAQRLDDALSSLVDTLIPVLPGEDEATADERHDDALDLARSIIDG